MHLLGSLLFLVGVWQFVSCRSENNLDYSAYEIIKCDLWFAFLIFTAMACNPSVTWRRLQKRKSWRENAPLIGVSSMKYRLVQTCPWYSLFQKNFSWIYIVNVYLLVLFFIFCEASKNFPSLFIKQLMKFFFIDTDWIKERTVNDEPLTREPLITIVILTFNYCLIALRLILFVIKFTNWSYIVHLELFTKGQ